MIFVYLIGFTLVAIGIWGFIPKHEKLPLSPPTRLTFKAPLEKGGELTADILFEGHQNTIERFINRWAKRLTDFNDVDERLEADLQKHLPKFNCQVIRATALLPDVPEPEPPPEANALKDIRSKKVVAKALADEVGLTPEEDEIEKGAKEYIKGKIGRIFHHQDRLR